MVSPRQFEKQRRPINSFFSSGLISLWQILRSSRPCKQLDGWSPGRNRRPTLVFIALIVVVFSKTTRAWPRTGTRLTALRSQHGALHLPLRVQRATNSSAHVQGSSSTYSTVQDDVCHGFFFTPSRSVRKKHSHLMRQPLSRSWKSGGQAFANLTPGCRLVLLPRRRCHRFSLSLLRYHDRWWLGSVACRPSRRPSLTSGPLMRAFGPLMIQNGCSLRLSWLLL